MLPAGFNLHDKETAEDPATGILIHYHAIAALLENGIGMAECAVSMMSGSACTMTFLSA
jgi:hypothetical protein